MSTFKSSKPSVVVLQKPSTAVEYLAAHLSKIHGLDWHPDSEHILATSSQDNSVKVSGPHWSPGGAACGRHQERVLALWKEACSLLVCRMCLMGPRAPWGLLTSRSDSVAADW